MRRFVTIQQLRCVVGEKPRGGDVGRAIGKRPMRRGLVRPGLDAGLLHRRNRVRDGGAPDAERHRRGDEPSPLPSRLAADLRRVPAAPRCRAALPAVRHHGRAGWPVNAAARLRAESSADAGELLDHDRAFTALSLNSAVSDGWDRARPIAGIVASASSRCCCRTRAIARTWFAIDRRRQRMAIRVRRLGDERRVPRSHCQQPGRQLNDQRRGV